jgi:ammonia channel protein AmtB
VGTVGHVGKGVEVVAVSRFDETVRVHPVHEAVSVVGAVVVAGRANARVVQLIVFVAVLGDPALEIAALLIGERGQVVQVGVELVAILAAMLFTIDDEVNSANL